MTRRRVKSTLRGQIYGPLPDRASGCSLLVITWGWGSGVEKWLWLPPNSKAPRQRKNGVQHPCSQGPWAPKPSFKTVQECVALCLEGTENDKFPMVVTGASFLNHGHVTGRRPWPLCHYYYWFSYQVSWLKTKNIKELPYCKRSPYAQIHTSSHRMNLPDGIQLFWNITPSPTHAHVSFQSINKKYFRTVWEGGEIDEWNPGEYQETCFPSSETFKNKIDTHWSGMTLAPLGGEKRVSH